MSKTESIRMVVENLKGLFSRKDSLQGFDDWDCFIGCIMELERVAGEIAAEQASREAEAYQQMVGEPEDGRL